MKLYLSLLVFLLGIFSASAQQELTPAILKKILAEADQEAAAFKQTLNTEDRSADWIEFTIDTFRITTINNKRMDVDFSTQGMNETVMETAAAYDKLMNKYYNKLLKWLKPEDKKVLVTAQKAWLAFRDAERKLIGVTRKDEYSGGGTIQTNIYTGMYESMIEARAIDIFNYYDEIVKEK